MPRPAIQLNDYISLAVMLLMSVALIAGQADARGADAQNAYKTAPAAVMPARFEEANRLEFHGRLSDKALEVSFSVVKDLGQFRGEDE